MDAGRKHNSWVRDKRRDYPAKQVTWTSEHSCQFLLFPESQWARQDGTRWLHACSALLQQRYLDLREPEPLIMWNKDVIFLSFPGGSVVKYACQCKRHGFSSWVRVTTWRRKWQHTPVFLPGKSHERGSLVGYCSWGCKRVGYIFVTIMTITINSLFQKNTLSLSLKAVCWTNILFWDSMKCKQSTWFLTRRAEMGETNHHFPPALTLTKNLYRFKSSNLSRSLFSFLDIMASYF